MSEKRDLEKIHEPTHEQKVSTVTLGILDLFAQINLDLVTALEALVMTLAITTTDADVALGPVVCALHLARARTDAMRKAGGEPVAVPA